MNRTWSRRAQTLRYSALGLSAIYSLFPVLWIVRMSLMPGGTSFEIPPVWTFTPTLDSYKEALSGNFASVDAFSNLMNSIIIAVASTLVICLVSIPGAYATSHMRFRGRGAFVGAVLATRVLPPVALIVPLFVYMQQLQLTDTRTGLVLAYVGLNLPFSYWMIHGFMGSIPHELVESARVDGASSIRIIWSIILPLLGPGLVAAASFAFIFAWNDFAIASVLSTGRARTLPMVILSFKTPEGIAWGQMTAMATIAMLPPMILVLLTQRWMVRGLTMGAVKG